MNAPKIFYNCGWVKSAGQVVAKMDSWEALTVPQVGIFMTASSKKNVDTKLFKHEFKHWIDGYAKPLQFLLMIGMQYLTVGYKKAPLELAAQEYSKQPLTKEEETWII